MWALVRHGISLFPRTQKSGMTVSAPFVGASRNLDRTASSISWLSGTILQLILDTSHNRTWNVSDAPLAHFLGYYCRVPIFRRLTENTK